jgi:hypothetical protein
VPRRLRREGLGDGQQAGDAGGVVVGAVVDLAVLDPLVVIVGADHQHLLGGAGSRNAADQVHALRDDILVLEAEGLSVISADRLHADRLQAGFQIGPRLDAAGRADPAALHVVGRKDAQVLQRLRAVGEVGPGRGRRVRGLAAGGDGERGQRRQENRLKH